MRTSTWRTTRSVPSPPDQSSPACLNAEKAGRRLCRSGLLTEVAFASPLLDQTHRDDLATLDGRGVDLDRRLVDLTGGVELHVLGDALPRVRTDVGVDR